jgi:hypothetical protein
MSQYAQQKLSFLDAKKINSFAFMRGLLSDGGMLEVIDEKYKCRFLIRGVLYATLELNKNLLIVKFKRPKDLRGLSHKLSYYNELEDPKGWLEFVTYADDSFQDQIRADLGSYIGQIIGEINSSDMIQAT